MPPTAGPETRADGEDTLAPVAATVAVATASPLSAALPPGRSAPGSLVAHVRLLHGRRPCIPASRVSAPPHAAPPLLHAAPQHTVPPPGAPGLPLCWLQPPPAAGLSQQLGWRTQRCLVPHLAELSEGQPCSQPHRVVETGRKKHLLGLVVAKAQDCNTPTVSNWAVLK
jgi:hypothetical protein